MLTVRYLFLRMDRLMLQENLQEKPARVILIKIYLKKEFMLKTVPIKKKAFTDSGENELGEITENI